MLHFPFVKKERLIFIIDPMEIKSLKFKSLFFVKKGNTKMLLAEGKAAKRS